MSPFFKKTKPMKVQNPIIGRSRGSAGGMTFCKNYDKNVARAKAFEVSNPKTASQTNQRTFFKEVMDITKTVSDEELRSLFGIKPKAMSRRNALSKQIAAAYSVVDGQKVVDFSKLQAIGNGQKVTTPIVEYSNGRIVTNYSLTPEMFGSNVTADTNIIAVFFDTDKNSIKIINTDVLLDEYPDCSDVFGAVQDITNGFGYTTCASDGSNVFDKSFGSFTLKTRANRKENPSPTPTSTIDIQARGYAAGDSFVIDLNGTSAAGGTPTNLVNDGNVVAAEFSIASDDIFMGSFTESIDPSAASTLLVTMPDTTQITMNVNFVDLPH